MQQDHAAVANTENHAAQYGCRQVCYEPPTSPRQAARTAAGQEATEFDLLNVLTNGMAVGFGQFENLFPNRLAAGRVHDKTARAAFSAIDHQIICGECAKIGTAWQALSQPGRRDEEAIVSIGRSFG